MENTSSYRDSHLEKGDDYHQTFDAIPHRAMTWRLEQRILKGFADRHFGNRKFDHLDFACGTGRILGLLAPFSGTATGLDVSAKMLEVAAQSVPRAELLTGDITQSDSLGDRAFDVITAFRFFPNAEPELRRDVMHALVKHLRPGGYLVFNNHKNTMGLARVIAQGLGRAGRGSEPSAEIDRFMSHAEVETLVSGAGLKIVEIHPVAVLPMTERHMPIPASIAEPVERVLAHLPFIRVIAQGNIYVCSAGRR